jgi:hypothetical protein
LHRQWKENRVYQGMDEEVLPEPEEKQITVREGRIDWQGKI